LLLVHNVPTANPHPKKTLTYAELQSRKLLVEELPKFEGMERSDYRVTFEWKQDYHTAPVWMRGGDKASLAHNFYVQITTAIDVQTKSVGESLTKILAPHMLHRKEKFVDFVTQHNVIAMYKTTVGDMAEMDAMHSRARYTAFTPWHAENLLRFLYDEFFSLALC
jgi:hypothetical protein